MIPIRLTLKNFMSYHDSVPPLSFEGIHTAVISGDNGHGKSSLIDAMTWALWGKARAKSDDDLVHLGENEMSVEFEFAVASEHYRIIRKHARPKRSSGQGKTLLEFQVASDGGYKALTGDSIADTQKKIRDTLHMDYETFVNSALLLQGRADAFTVKRPVERKQVLADILGLSVYDDLETRAKEHTREREIARTQMTSALGELAGELAQRPTYEAELVAAESGLAATDKTVAETETRLNGLRREKTTLEGQQTELNQVDSRIAKAARDIERWQDTARKRQARLRSFEELIEKRPTIEEGYTKLAEARKINEDLDRKLRQSAALEKQKSQLESKIDKARNELTSEHTVVQREMERLETRGKALPDLKNQLGLLQGRLRKLEADEAMTRQKEAAANDLRTQASHLEAEIAQLDREVKEVGEKLDLISAQIASHTEARCPLCESELTREGLELIQSKYLKEKQDKSAALLESRKDLVQKQTECDAAQKEKTQLEARLNQEKTAIHSQQGALNKQIAEIEGESKNLAGLRETLEGIERRLATRDFAASEQQAVALIETELSGLGYDPVQHEAARQKLASLDGFAELKRQLDEAEKLIGEERQAIAEATEAERDLATSLETEKQKRLTLAGELTRLPKVADEFGRVEGEYRALSLKQREAQQQVGSLKAKLERLAEQEARQREKEKELARLADEEQIYRELAQAFGKKGIQALLIETALPEIEAEANDLLARMTDNRMHLRFETQRETKAGNVAETLDIKIADDLGTRNYELYSGGEAFRINFAIRIALSRLLARRAGAPLPTLIIDEGFGTQDASGIEKLKEAINSIQNDFEKILVITHLEELKDAFPTRINVVKTDSGSTIEVS